MPGNGVTVPLGLRLYDDELTTAQATQLARRAEASGYTTVWTPEGAGKEAFGQLTAYAVATDRIQLGTGIVNVYTRTPSLVAMALASLDQLSGGRAILGLGAGHRADLEQGHGVVFARPFRRIREYVALIRAILGGHDLPSTPLCSVTRFRLGFTPERTAVPIYLAALGPEMCELAGEIADGVLLNWATPEYVPEAVAHVRIGAERAGRRVSDIPIACYVRTAAAREPHAAASALARELTRYIGVDVYRRLLDQSGFADDTRAVTQALSQGVEVAARKVSDRLLDALAVIGSEATRTARLEQYRRAGVTQPVIAPVAAGADRFESWAMAIDGFAPPAAGPGAS
jgi:probable F420-dependent oxidoreductase